jgi:hypothetical protein
MDDGSDTHSRNPATPSNKSVLEISDDDDEGDGSDSASEKPEESAEAELG